MSRPKPPSHLSDQPPREPQPDGGEEAGRPVLGEDDALVRAHEPQRVAGRCLGQGLRGRVVAVEYRLDRRVAVLAERPRAEDQPRPFLGFDWLGADDDPGEEAIRHGDVPAALGRRLVRGEPEVELLERERATAPVGCHAAAFRSVPVRSAFQASRTSIPNTSSATASRSCASSASACTSRCRTPRRSGCSASS
jgi:hypothetical protein